MSVSPIGEKEEEGMVRIEKDAEWQRLEGRVGQLRGDLCEAEKRLRAYASQYVASELGLVIGETVVTYNGARYLVSRVEASPFDPWVYGRKFKKDGTPSLNENTLYAGKWAKE